MLCCWLLLLNIILMHCYVFFVANCCRRISRTFCRMSIGGGAYGLPRLKSDVCLFSWRRSNIYGLDLLTIPAPNWLSDSTINFCFDYFQYEKFSSDQQQYLCFVPATAAFMIASTNDLDDISDAVHGCGMTAAEIRLVFIPSMHHPVLRYRLSILLR